MNTSFFLNSLSNQIAIETMLGEVQRKIDICSF